MAVLVILIISVIKKGNSVDEWTKKMTSRFTIQITLFIILFSIFFIHAGKIYRETLPLLLPGATHAPLQVVSINENCNAVAVWVENVSDGGTGEAVVGALFENDTWSSANKISDANGFSAKIISDNQYYRHEIAVDINNNKYAYAVWLDDNGAENIWGSLYNPNTSSWGTPTLVTNVSGVPVGRFGFIDVVIDHNDTTINVIWGANETSSIKYVQSTDGGANWTSPISLVTNPPGLVFDYSFAKSDNKNIAVGMNNLSPISVPSTFISHYNAASNIWTIADASNPDITTDSGFNFIYIEAVGINNDGNIIGITNELAHVSTSNRRLNGVYWNGASWNSHFLVDTMSISPLNAAIDFNNNNQGLSIGLLTSSNSPYSHKSFTFDNGIWSSIDANAIQFSAYIYPFFFYNDNGNGVFLGITTGNNQRAFYSNTSGWHANKIIKAFDGTITSAGFHHATSNGIVITSKLETAIYCNTVAPFSINPPKNIGATCALNRFPGQGDFFSVITWDASVSNDEVGYNIYRNKNTFIAEVPSAQKNYIAHNNPQGPVLFSVSAIDSGGDQSIEISATTECI